MNQYKLGVVINYITIFLNIFIAIIITPFLINTMGEGQYGLYKLMVSFVGYMTVLGFGFDRSSVRYLSQFHAQNDKKKEEEFISVVLEFIVIISIIVIIIAGILYLNLNNLFKNSLSNEELRMAKEIFLYLVTGIIVSLFNGIFSAIVISYEKFIYNKLCQFISMLFRLALIFSLMQFRKTALMLTIIDFSIGILFFLINIYYVHKVFCIRIKVNFKRISKENIIYYRGVIRYSFFVFINMLIEQLLWNVDSFIIGKKLSTAGVTVYSVGANFSHIFYNISLTFGGMLMPQIVLLAVNGLDKEKLNALFMKIGRLQLLIIAYIYSAFCIVGKQFIFIWMGDGYESSWKSASFVMIGLGVSSIFNLGHTILQAINNQRYYICSYLIAFIANAVGTYLIVDTYGVVGAGFITMLSFLVCQLILINPYLQKKVKLDIKGFLVNIFKRIIPCAILCGIIGNMICKRIIINQWYIFIFIAVLYSFLYWGIMWIIAMDESERKLLGGYFRIKKR